MMSASSDWVCEPKCFRQSKRNCIFPQDKCMVEVWWGWKIACNNCTASGFLVLWPQQRKGSFAFPFQNFHATGPRAKKIFTHPRWCYISLPSHLFSPNFPAEWMEMCGYCWPYITPCELDSFAKITQSIK